MFKFSQKSLTPFSTEPFNYQLSKVVLSFCEKKSFGLKIMVLS